MCMCEALDSGHGALIGSARVRMSLGAVHHKFFQGVLLTHSARPTAQLYHAKAPPNRSSDDVFGQCRCGVPQNVSSDILTMINITTSMQRTLLNKERNRPRLREPGQGKKNGSLGGLMRIQEVTES
jgi:hypothetical protein